ncbi:homoserine dehydrogenase [Alicyclobacillus cycloheptanicus]|uniref:Homoserine dehydrogenase n=1 Tax=Alicyclobacillus cycloheptanicus TaxID=1457 RepID=A0ABT9XI51_9BACL|nr:homoserine dehydrogenase [Alicyclobacillus cycloheptanicus]MDQ0189987.1 homoserine dehydrogenase [Alicyclobacillus cycloheptanicus]
MSRTDSLALRTDTPSTPAASAPLSPRGDCALPSLGRTVTTAVPDTLRIGLLGCGVVGGGVVETLHQNARHIEAEHGVRLDIVRAAVRDVQRERSVHVRRSWLCSDWREVCEADDVDLVIEVMGGTSPAREAIATALTHGKHVVTANKQLLAACGVELQALAATVDRRLLFEASVLGGIPAIHILHTYFGANRIRALRGIVNGTSNYILTQMADTGLSFADALAEAQRLGYAEADPSADVEGYDALYKLQILARCGLRIDLPEAAVTRVGIMGVTSADLAAAKRLGCKVKHVAEVRLAADGRVSAQVAPVVVAPSDPLYAIDGVQNALVVTGDLVGDLTFAGPGAGAWPTASAIVEDVLKVIKAVPGHS